MKKALWFNIIILGSFMSLFVLQHREFSKGKKRVATELHDKEKLSDSLLSIGESYQKLRIFSKARKWYMKSWNTYRAIGNLEVSLHVLIRICEYSDMPPT
jgi:hypothetical protein